MFLVFRTGSAACLLAFSASVIAQDQIAQADSVVITASRFEQSLEKTMADVNVIDREEINASGYSQLSDLLFSIPGVRFSSNGGGQQTSSVSLRGQPADSTLVLIDGFRVGQLSGFGGPSIQTLPLQSIERIEILRGNGSALYGADAIGGVIQIVTRKPEKSGFEVATSVGTNQTYGLDVQGYLVGERSSVTAGVGYQESKGYPVRTDRVAGGNNVDDPYRRNHGSISLERDLGEGYSLSLQGLNSVSHAQYDSGGAQANSSVFQDLYSAKLDKNWGQGRKSSVRFGQTGERLTFPGAFFFETRSYQTQFQAEHFEPTPIGMLLAGVEVLKQDFRSTFAPAVNQVEAESLLLGLTGESGAWDYQVNLRQDNNDVFDDALTGSIALSRDFGLSHRLGASVGQGFKRPSFNQISGFLNTFSDPGLTSADVVNTDLKPQTSDTLEIYYQWSQGVRKARVTAYSVVVEDQINNVLVGTSSSRSVNVDGDSEARGFSVEYEAMYQQVRYGVFAEYLDARLATGQRVLRSARRSGRLFASTKWNAFNFQADLLLAGDRREAVFGSSDVNLGGYGVVNAVVGYQICPRSSLTVRVDNLFGKEYQLAREYNNPNQDVFVTYRYTF